MDNISYRKICKNLLLAGCLIALCAAAEAKPGARLDFIKPNNWSDGPPKDGEISLVTNTGAHLFLTAGGPMTETAMEWAIAELEVLKGEFAGNGPSSNSEVQIKDCKVITAPKEVPIQGKTWVMLASECGLEKNRQTIRLRTEEYVYKDGDMLIRANLADETARLEQLDRPVFEQVLASARITDSASPQRVDLKDSEFAHWKNVGHPVYVNEPFAVAWETPKGWASLNQFHDAQGKSLGSLPEGTLSVFKKDYPETAPRGLSSSMVLQVLEFKDSGKPLVAALREEVLNHKLPDMEVTTPAAETTLGGRAWATAEMTQHVPFQDGERVLKHKIYLTANKDAWQRDVLILVKASAVPEEYSKDVTVFNATVANMKFGKDIAAGLLKEQLKTPDGTTAKP